MRFSCFILGIVVGLAGHIAPAAAATTPVHGAAFHVARIETALSGLGAQLSGLGEMIGAVAPALGRATARPLAAAPAPAALPASPGAFASVAIPVGAVGLAGKWQAMRAGDHRAYFTADCAAAGFGTCGTAFGRGAQELFSRAQGLEPLAAIRLVNREINALMAYAPDRTNWGMADRWANPAEIGRNGAGDCEDFAIAKYWLLRALGFEEGQLQLVVLQDTRRQLYHAVLVAHVGGHRYVLDNLSGTLRLDSTIPDYMPLVSFLGDKTYLHGFEGRRTMTAMPADLGAVSPGEGV